MFELIDFSVFTIGVNTFLPQITGLGIQLICSAIILAVAAEVIYFIHINPDVGYGIMGLFILVIASIVFWSLIHYSKKLLALSSFSKWKKIKPTKS
jgi:hypothetical protein